MMLRVELLAEEGDSAELIERQLRAWHSRWSRVGG